MGTSRKLSSANRLPPILPYVAQDLLRTEQHRRHSRVVRIVVGIVVGIVVVPVMAYLGLIIIMAIALRDRTVVSEHPEQDVRYVLKGIGEWDVLVQDAKCTEIYGGFHGDGNSWYSCQVSPETAKTMIANLAQNHHATRSSAGAGKTTGGGAPGSWTPTAHADLVAYDVESPRWWIGISPSTGRIYIRLFRW